MEKGKDRLRQAQEEVEENRADELLEKSKGFKKTTTKLKQQNRWENMKMKVVVGGILAVVVVVLVIVVTMLTCCQNSASVTH
ncbi:hypothetical protein ANANG_G00187450 [Anguilla anguilla]|uniref:V-SNARE coiled-coil homology domain-containing protein n=1 Tax=Anguilla anguilla TaxID=7936 RepID=A0A9D3M2A4_ANGAN|nr:hypothetical protein ANANG_G00187450 [Anguilla anguilla]